MKEYKVKKEIRYGKRNGEVVIFPVGSQISSKDLLSPRQEKGFVNDKFIEEIKKKGKKDD